MKSHSIRLLIAMVASLMATAILASSAAAATTTTEAASSVTASRATLNGKIGPEGHKVSYSFKYGKTTEYESFTNAKVIAAGQYTPVAVSVPIEGLEPDQTYHFVLATLDWSTGKIVFGKDLTFHTSHRPRFEADEYPVTVSGAQDTGAPFELLSFEGESVVCESAQWSGDMSAAATGLSLDASYEGCELEVGSAEVSMNSCHYDLGLANAGPPYSGSGAIACGKGGDAIEIEIPSIGCTISIAAQSLGTVGYQNQGQGAGGTVAADVAATGVDYASEGYGCFLLAGEGDGEAGTIGGEITLEGLDEEEAQVGLRVTGEKLIGLRVSGEKSEEPAKQPRFEADEYPVTVSGAQDTGAPFELLSFEVEGESFTVTCESTQWSGDMSAAANGLSLDASYEGCEELGTGLSAEVTMNSCHYDLGLANAGPPYSGSGAIACDKGGDAIEIEIPSIGCTISIAAQSLGTVGYQNQGQGAGSTVAADVAATGVDYASSGYGCFLLAGEGDGEAGTIGGEITLGDVN